MAKKACMLCTKTTDDISNLGEKYTYKNVTAHHYCLLLSAEIKQSGHSNQGIHGYLLHDIEVEMQRTQKTMCYICKTKGANIRCCRKSCELSFHLTCGLKAGCQNQFHGMFDSYCELHNQIDEPTYNHKSDDVCIICYDEMGEYHPNNSIQSPCCSKNSWYHKKCLTEYAKTSANSTKCPLCNNSDLFRQTILNRGIYIPKKKPEWKEWDSFYDSLQQFTLGPSCSAERCICWRGRTYEPLTRGRKFSFLFCQCCGSKAIHRKCFGEEKFEDFICDDCEIFSRFKSIHEIQFNDNDKHSLDENDSIILLDDQNNTNENSNLTELNLKPLSIVLQRLEPAQTQLTNGNQTSNIAEFNIKPLSIALQRLRPSQIQI